MTVFRSAIVFSLMASVSPLAAQTALNDRPGMWISVQPEAPASQPEILTAPDSAPLIAAAPSGGVVLDATGSASGVILEHPAIAAPAETAAAPSTRPTPRPDTLAVVADVIDPEPEEDQDVAIIVDAAYSGPRPQQRPREVEEVMEPPAEESVPPVVEEAAVIAVDPTPEVAPVEDPAPQVAGVEIDDAAALAAELAAMLADDAHDIMAAAPFVSADTVPDLATLAPEDIVVASAFAAAEAQPRLAPTPTALHAVAAMSPRNQPASLSAVLLPGTSTGARPTVQPAAFLVPREDPAPVLSRPLPEGPSAQEEVAAPEATAPATLAAVLMPGPSPAPDRAEGLSFAAQPAPDMFPYSALPPELLPNAPDAQARSVPPTAPAPEAMAAVLLTEPRPAPQPLPPLSLPDMPLADEPPIDPDAAPELPAPDANAVARMIADAAICWQYADLGAEAGWARLSVSVALDEMNMPAAQSIQLTGFGHVMSSSAAEAFDAARGALIGCAEASGSEPATRPATLVFDRNGVRLR
ncbi:hypothetical protein [Gymnodinialimonas hymeniacidonis]|uniref:hypothetical protein n=1 Tax=Gymnodinialimonas hymeniacidonis TaxID=3126508 RepID=UPI0034C63060